MGRSSQRKLSFPSIGVFRCQRSFSILVRFFLILLRTQLFCHATPSGKP